MTSSLPRTKSLFKLSNIPNHNVEESSHNLNHVQDHCHIKYDAFLKCLTIFTNMTVGSIVIYNLYYINKHLIELKDAVQSIF
jgi:hypothetical protein